ncbi:DUF1680 domain-containing protein [Fusarium pseudoanthophilum]|uniref:DUF1680 domain-containing protein n=1 Tax=Fusarium pseudoanthophilum TaxID=48495 RepID=A0A8H5Q6D4_9HYPO|nr:DUF1680 domain-containing protein [Fusarium pseudoanthophilum]
MWPVPYLLFWDSDIAKWIGGACYFLADPDEYGEDVDQSVRELVDTTNSAQQRDGYLNLHYTVVEQGKRWTNIRDAHELYNAGHLIEAAIAHKEYYRNNILLEPIEKYVSLITEHFDHGEDQLKGYPGHPEIELSRFRLYAATGNTGASTWHGHAVRAGHLLIAVVDMLHLSAESGRVLPDPQAWSQALHKLWDNMVDRKMYLTGGIGAMA